MKGKFWAIALLVVIVVLATSFYLVAQPAPSSQEVKIGVILPLSGRDGSVGRDIKVAVELASDLVNSKHDLDLPLARTEGLPGLDGADIEVIFADSGGEPDVGRAEAERLIVEENVVALTGAWHSSVTKPSSDIAEKFGIPFICGSSTASSLTDRGYVWFFRTTPDTVTFSDAMLQFTEELNGREDVELRTVMIVSVNDEWGMSAVEAEEHFVKERGFELVETVIYDIDIEDVSGQALKIKMRNPDILIQNSFTADAILFMKEYKKLNWFPTLFLVQDTGFETVEFLQTMGEDADFIVSRSAWAGLDNKNSLVKEVNELYKSRHPDGVDMDGNTAREFTAFMVLAEAINRAGSTEPEKICNSLAETDWSADLLITGWSGVKFDATGQNIEATPALLQRLDGCWITVWPSERAVAEAQVPSPNWDQRE